MLYPTRGSSLLQHRYAPSRYGRPRYGLLDVLDQPDLVRASEPSDSNAPSLSAAIGGFSPMRWLTGQVGLFDLLDDADNAEVTRVPISAREPAEPTWFDRAKSRFHEMFPPVPTPEMVRDGKGGVWRKDIYDLIEDIATAEPEDEAALRQRIQDVLADSPHTRDFWFHYELSNRLDGDDSETVRTALRDRGHEMSIRAREILPQILGTIALGGKGRLPGGEQPAAVPPTVVKREVQNAKPASLERTGSSSSITAEKSSTTATNRRRRQNVTRGGIHRTKETDWRAYRDLWDDLGYGDMLSPANRALIARGRSPIVDEAWIKFNPEDAGLAGEIIEIHHVANLLPRVPWPETRHRDLHREDGGTNKGPAGPGSAWPPY